MTTNETVSREKGYYNP